MKTSRSVLVRIFLLAGCVCGILWWGFADRWAYYEDAPGHRQPKFLVSTSWLVMESAIAGVMGGSLAAGAWAWLRRNRASRRSA
jgi:hypothetical protein